MNTKAICQICNKEKDVCCQFIGHYTYCKDCCPYKEDHIKDRAYAQRKESERENEDYRINNLLSDDMREAIKRLLTEELLSHGLIEGSAEDE